MIAASHYAETGGTLGFDKRWRESPGGRELHKVRNIRPGFRHGLWLGLANAGLETVTLGKLPWTLPNHADDKALKRLDDYVSPDRGWGDRDLPPRDRLAFVFFASTTHDENQPTHLKVADLHLCATTCTREFGNPCTNFCPANVYEMIDDGAGGRKLQINASNCVHCKACDIKEPYTDQITWVTPEGGSGPNYQSL
jgi:electron-transferring-flavoprotein dehydrogenase